MALYKNIAIVGVGVIGTPIAEELLNAKSTGAIDKVVILTRPESVSKHDALAARGATIVPIADYTSVSDVTRALAGVDVVISALVHNALHLQVPIAEAAKAAGVQLFVPSEFGTEGDDEFYGKKALNEKISAFLPVSRFYVGGFSDHIWSPFLDLDLKSGSVGAGGDGNAKASFTSRTDVARYVVYVLTTLSPPETKNKIFRIEGENASLNEIFAAYEKKHGVKLRVKYTPVEELQENMKRDPYDIKSFLCLLFATGKASVGSPTDNGLYPDWNPKPVLHYL